MKKREETEKGIWTAVEGLLEDDALFVVGVQLKGHTGASRLVVHIDGDRGVDIDACSRISRRLSAHLDEHGLITGAYTLEVSSAGLDQPLVCTRQYRKNVGRTLKIRTVDQKMLSGTLSEVLEDSIRLQLPGSKKNPAKAVILPFIEIENATVEVAFK